MVLAKHTLKQFQYTNQMKEEWEEWAPTPGLSSLFTTTLITKSRASENTF